MEKDLSRAIKDGRLSIVRLLLRQNKNNTENKTYALKVAAKHGKLEIVQMLLDHGTDIRANDSEALWLAAENGFYDVVRLLLENGAYIHGKQDLALRMAAENGFFEIVKLLVENGADVNAADDDALQMAAQNKHKEIVKFLLQQGANIHTDVDYVFVTASRNKDPQMVDILLDHLFSKEERRESFRIPFLVLENHWKDYKAQILRLLRHEPSLLYYVSDDELYLFARPILLHDEENCVGYVANVLKQTLDPTDDAQEGPIRILGLDDAYSICVLESMVARQTKYEAELAQREYESTYPLPIPL